VTLRVSDIDEAISQRFPPERAEPWDRVGLLAGDPMAKVTGVAVGLDPTPSAIAAAVDADANVLVTHHPAFLEPPKKLTAGKSGGGALVFSAIEKGVALISAHTNLDRDACAQRLLPERLGLKPVHALESAPMPMAVVTVFVPPDALASVREAMAAAGAGRIGEYRGCSFAASGHGAFVAGETTDPHIGRPGEFTEPAEARLEMVCPRALVPSVIAAAVARHPYEEPLVTAAEMSMARNSSALGMLSKVATADGTGGAGAPDAPDASITLAEFARRAAAAFEVTPRVWGDPASSVSCIATVTGSGGSLIGDAVRAGAQVLLAGEVRYHDALKASEGGLAVVELGHDVSEWPLVGLLAEAVSVAVGTSGVPVTVLPARPHWFSPDALDPPAVRGAGIF